MSKILKNLAYPLAIAAATALGASAHAEDRVFWISIGDSPSSEAALDTAINFAEANNFNAISILARYRADALYIPNRDFTTYPNAEPRRFTNTDAVQYVIDKAHEKDMRVYAAWSCFIVTDGSDTIPSVIDSAWLQHYYQGGTDDSTYDPDPGFPRQMIAADAGGDGLWIDPGVSAVRDYTLDVTLDFLENYDVDGIIFDRVRYPGDSFPRRSGTFGYNPTALAAYGLTDPVPNDSTFLEARRDAVTDFLEEAQAAIHALKPWVIVGTTPVVFGTSTGDTYNFVYQDIPEWNSRATSTAIHSSGLGVVDVVMPQYYRIDPADNDTLMGLIVPDTSNVGHVATFGSFLAGTTGDEVAQNICDMRQYGMDGFGIFSSSSMQASSGQFLTDLRAFNTTPCGTDVLSASVAPFDYTLKTGWDSADPGNISDLMASSTGLGENTLTWSAATDAVRYLVYRSESPTVNPYYENLVNKDFDITGTSFVDDLDEGLTPGDKYYLVVPVDDYNNKGTSNTAGPVTPNIPELIVESRTSGAATTAAPAYAETGSFSNTTAKSAAPGLTGSGSRFSTTIGNTASFSPAIAEGGLYHVYLTIDGDLGTNPSAIANSDWTLTSNADSTQTGNVDIEQGVAALDDSWLQLTATPIAIAAGAAGSASTITFENLDGDGASAAPGNRFNMDAVRYLFAGVADVTAPNATGIMLSGSSPTNASTVQFAVTFDEDVQNFNNASDVVITTGGTATASFVSISQTTPSQYTVTLNGLGGTGTVQLAVSTSSDVQDLAGNALASSADDSVLVDFDAPIAVAAVAATYKVTGDVAVTATGLSDSGSAITSATLYAREEGIGSWLPAGSILSGTFNYTPPATGTYEFLVTAQDTVGNAQAAPTSGTSGDDSVLYSDTANDFTAAVVPSSTVSYPMTDSRVLTLTYSAGASGGPIRIQRIFADAAPGGYDADDIIDEYLTITGVLTAGTADLNWTYETSSLDGLSPTRVFRDNGGSVTELPSGPIGVTFGAQDVTVTGITAFSDWYIGIETASEHDWMTFED
ncbi:MAG: family 10 glycosylhydrolase [Sumerlaeia bacterium]